jgi:hypothetical protein
MVAGRSVTRFWHGCFSGLMINVTKDEGGFICGVVDKADFSHLKVWK